jgi:hypothetical protein
MKTTIINYPPTFHQITICPVVKDRIAQVIPEDTNFYPRYSRIQEFWQAIPHDQREAFETAIVFDCDGDETKINNLVSRLYLDNKENLDSNGILEQLKVDYPKAFEYHCAQVLKAQKQVEKAQKAEENNRKFSEFMDGAMYVAPVIGEMLVSVAMIGGIVWGGAFVTSPIWGGLDNKLDLQGAWSSYDSTQALFGDSRPFQMIERRDGSVDIITSENTQFDSLELEIKYVSGPDTKKFTLPRSEFKVTNGGIIYNLSVEKDEFSTVVLSKVNK